MTHNQYLKSLRRLKEIFHAPKGSKEYKEAEKLEKKIEEYEEKKYPIITNFIG